VWGWDDDECRRRVRRRDVERLYERHLQRHFEQHIVERKLRRLLQPCVRNGLHLLQRDVRQHLQRSTELREVRDDLHG
jgi:hypothetical protein